MSDVILEVLSRWPARFRGNIWLELASQLSSAERLRLVERIVHDMAAPGEATTSGRRRSWSEIRGRVAYPLCGEDAQAWVSRTRSES